MSLGGQNCEGTQAIASKGAPERSYLKKIGQEKYTVGGTPSWKNHGQLVQPYGSVCDALFRYGPLMRNTKTKPFGKNMINDYVYVL